jgi:cytochrome c oxidase cbb3-type subunit 3
LQGRAGTAIQGFRGLLSESDVAAVAEFVLAEFVRCGRPNASYHTAANGWPDHLRRYGKAFPFALGQISPDTPPDSLSPEEQQGRQLFLRACITCHMPALYRAESAQHADDEEYGEYGAGADPDDVSPQLAGLTAAEKRGEALYRQNCAYCHGANGKGRNAIGSFLEPHPPDFGDMEPRNMTTEALVGAIQAGKPASSMPAFRTVLSDDDAAAIAAYLQRAFLTE